MAKTNIAKSTKSGGPKTEEGKKVTSRNALKTGAYSNTLILPGEDESEFRQMEEQFARDFDPRDMAEIAMVRDLAILAWKKVRLENLELRFILDRLARPLDFSEQHQFSFLNSKVAKDYLSTPSEYTIEYQQKLEQAAAFTQQMIHKLSANQLVEKDLEDLKKNCPILAEHLIGDIAEYEIFNPTAVKVLRYTITNGGGKEESFLAVVFKNSLQYFQSELKCFENMDEIRKQSKALQDQRLMALMENPKSSRAFDDLRRNFYRTLTELRKHQEWRHKMRAIDIADQSKTIEEGAKD